ncbi:MAG: DUF4194 domain-containing protein [Opitutaceae bacterium]|nr:DUF4194 domain-containing protein [Opitutaceae bacterium]
MNAPDAPPRESSLVKIALLKGPIYFEDELLWRVVAAHREHLERYFADLGLEFRLNNEEGLAFLRQKQWPGGEAGLPALFRREELPYAVSWLGVLAREELQKHQQAHPDQPRLVEDIDAIAGWLAPYFGTGRNDAKERRQLYSIVRKAERHGLLRRVKDDSAERYEICRIIKLLFSLEALQDYKQRLRQARNANGVGENGEEAAGEQS